MVKMKLLKAILNRLLWIVLKEHHNVLKDKQLPKKRKGLTKSLLLLLIGICKIGLMMSYPSLEQHCKLGKMEI
jgi:hypothetical protein